MLLQLTNLATSLLAIGIDNVATSIVVSVGEGAKFPALAGNQWFPLVLVDAGGNTEIMRATARTSDTITVIRGQEGTVARSFLAGARVELRQSAAGFNSEIAILEKKTEGYIARTVTGGTLDLSSDTFNETMFEFNGFLAADQTIIVPARAKRFTILNRTVNGAFFVLVKTPSGTPVCIPQSTEKELIGDGVNVYRADRAEVGTIRQFAGMTAPAGTFNCTGGTLSRTLTPDLFAAIGTTWGTPSGSTYSLPDLVTNNRFLRAAGGSLAVGTTQTDDVKPHTHGRTGLTFAGTIASLTPTGTVRKSTDAAGSQYTPAGSITSQTINGQNTGVITNNGTGPFATTAGGANWGPVNGSTLSQSLGFSGTTVTLTLDGNAISYTPAGTITGTIDTSTGTESRPHNAAVMFCIRY